MDYINSSFFLNNYPDLDDQEPDKYPPTLIINLATCLGFNKNVFISVPYVPGLSEQFRRIFQHTSIQVIFKAATIPLK